ncbi:ABC transporter permease [Sphingomonas crocodyli]|nr:ABC transporter permease [Sphingomonas crocodyli]
MGRIQRLATGGAPRRWRWLSVAELTIGAGLFALVALAAIFGRLLLTHDPVESDLMATFLPMGSAGHLLGTDHMGRDMWSRVIAGLQWSMACAFTANAINLMIGTTLGLLAAERPGWTRTIARQTTDMFQSFPSMVVAIVVVVVIGHGFVPLVATLGFLSWPIFMRVAYAEASSIYARDYVKAARIAGVSRPAIMLGHVLPGLRASLMVVFALHFATLLIAESGLSFLGIGAPLGVPTWGNMLAEARQYVLVAPRVLLVPAAAIIFAVITTNLLGDGLAAYARRTGRGIEI